MQILGPLQGLILEYMVLNELALKGDSHHGLVRHGLSVLCIRVCCKLWFLFQFSVPPGSLDASRTYFHLSSPSPGQSPCQSSLDEGQGVLFWVCHCAGTTVHFCVVKVVAVLIPMTSPLALLVGSFGGTVAEQQHSRTWMELTHLLMATWTNTKTKVFIKHTKHVPYAL